jgi:DNA mismatch endonuclease (patch repair protein)
MADVVSPDVRSRMMAGIRGTNTKPELMLRRGLFAAGFRYRLHVRNLPGKPDMVFPRFKAVLFAHGCFWHGHDCHLFKMPSSRRDFWARKIASNRATDLRVSKELAASGWRQGVVWECALKGRTRLKPEEVIKACSSWLKSNQMHLELRGHE